MYTLEYLTSKGIKSLTFDREPRLTTTQTAELLAYVNGINNYVWYATA